jgi:cytochrome c-type biogenesis protein CcsB
MLPRPILWILQLLAISACTLTLSGPALAQTAPAGNAHPETQELTKAEGQIVNPFGEHLTRSTSSIEQKHAFSTQLDLTPLRGIAVFHNGRAKILDSLAREVVQVMTGRKDYLDFEKTTTNGGATAPATPATPAEKLKVTKYSYDPLFSMLDLTIDPAYYIDKALFGITYLPLRRAILEQEFGTDDATIERWMRVGRITPMMLEKHGNTVAREHMDQDPFRNALGRLDQASQLFIEGRLNYVLIAPERTDLPWQHLSTLPESAPARKAAADLGKAWRAGDAQAANSAIVALAAELPKINPSVYPTSRRDLETLYNRVNAFEYGYWLYFLSLLCLLLAFGTARTWLATAGIITLVLAIALHTFGFVARCIIAERFAIQNQFESMTGLSLFAAVVGSAIMLIRKQWLFGAAAAAVGFLVLVTATQTRIPGQAIEREAAILNTSILLKYHVTTVLVSYGLISLGFIISLFYLGTHYAARFTAPRHALANASTSEPNSIADAALSASSSGSPSLARTLADLDKAQMIILQLAFWTLGVGILLGAWWADHSWGRWWAFDPKETWALITWIVYLIVIHVRFTSVNRGLLTAWLSAAGFLIMLWTYFGVNLLLPGLHAYA